MDGKSGKIKITKTVNVLFDDYPLVSRYFDEDSLITLKQTLSFVSEWVDTSKPDDEIEEILCRNCYKELGLSEECDDLRTKIVKTLCAKLAKRIGAVEWCDWLSTLPPKYNLLINEFYTEADHLHSSMDDLIRELDNIVEPRNITAVDYTAQEARVQITSTAGESYNDAYLINPF